MYKTKNFVYIYNNNITVNYDYLCPYTSDILPLILTYLNLISLKIIILL